ncbi:MAG: hypothetical protein CVV32_03295 [Methanomicrobiales archaeon HGW-Methanomicrobiales-3]|nr:MAG: hypothetical protein CVV32_03295 [Methanomicrobiales archaeon HGW-Methanomicrobiales-3]
MIAKILHRLTTKILKLGYAHAAARFYAGFFIVEMVIVATLMGALRIVQDITDFEIPGTRQGACGQGPVRGCPALFLIQR